MTVYQALELRNEKGEGTGLYHYTCSDSGGTYAVGHCSPWENCPDCKGHSWMQSDFACGRCENKGILRKENPCPGHSTKAEAVSHHREYEMDNARYDGQHEDAQHRCVVCGTWTQGVVYMGEYRSYDLCDEHRNRAGLELVVNTTK